MKANYVNGYVFDSKRAPTKNFVTVFIFFALFEYDFAGRIRGIKAGRLMTSHRYSEPPSPDI